MIAAKGACLLICSSSRLQQQLSISVGTMDPARVTHAHSIQCPGGHQEAVDRMVEAAKRTVEFSDLRAFVAAEIAKAGIASTPHRPCA